ncbi:helix-turn-helix domain-containing protein [Komagataeibacter sp. FXV3]|uniref:helix-turn-helix domain-containing protein n=1 Tax=Komagataeibacter sp. FXV3 TaxID=2608998 RepID=UPI00187B9B0B|nr:helix-turn-helix domain-containing protein [Komagataeibacter sp. FXV3]MBE7731407.1 helix-turn-helix domain-containing protein [Komagataeibacter sp. FXV3]
MKQYSPSRISRAFYHMIRNRYYTDRGLTALRRDVLLKLGAYLGRTGCHPSMATLADECRASVRSVQRAVQWAAEQGLIAIKTTTRRMGNRIVRGVHYYTLIVDPERQGKERRLWLARSVIRQIRNSVSPQDRVADQASTNIFSKGISSYPHRVLSRNQMLDVFERSGMRPVDGS